MDNLSVHATQQTIGITSNAPPAITVPSAQTVGQSVLAPISGISIADAASSGTLTVTITDTAGTLAATGATGTAHSLSITGSVATVNTDLASLTFDDTSAGSDTITINANDTLGGIATQQTIGVTIDAAPVIAVPGAQTVEQGVNTLIPAISVTDAVGTLTVTITDTTGTLSATGATGTAHSLTIAGSVSTVNTDLATLKFSDAASGPDTIVLNAHDTLGAVALQQTIGVTSNAPPAITVPGLQIVGVAVAAPINGISITDAASSGTVTVTLTDTAGTLAATGATGTAHSLTITGSVTTVNTDLASLTFDDASAGSDTITINANDTLGGVAVQQTVSVTIANGLGISVPGAQTVEQGINTLIPSVSVSDGASSVTVTIADTTGTLSATGATGTAHNLVISGSVSTVNTDLATLKFDDTSAGTDTITLNAVDNLSVHATQQTIGVTSNAPPAITVPGAQTVGVAVAAPISGISITDATSSGTVTVTLTDTAGTLAATGATGTAHSLTIIGSVATINTDLATLTFNDASAGGDTIDVNANDALGGIATQQTVSVTIANGLGISVPGAQTVEQGINTLIPSVSVSDGASSVTVTITDTTGTLSATGATGTAHSLVITGSVSTVNTDLATLKFDDAAAGTDTITLNAVDNLSVHATQQTIGVTSNAPPAITVPGAQTVGQGVLVPITGISLTDAASSGTVTVTVTDTAGTLAATGATGTAHSLTITGSVTTVNTDLASLTFDDTSAGSDTITINANDTLGGIATQQTIGVTIDAAPVIAVPGAQTVEQGVNTLIPSVSVTDAVGTLTVTITDTTGTLSATGATGTAHSLTIAGSVSTVNTDLATLKFSDAASGPDTIVLNAHDTLGAVALQQTINVTSNAPPVITVPGAQTAVPTVADPIIGISIADAASSGAVTVTLTDTAGVLASTGGVATNGGHTLTITGALATVNTDLASLTFTDAFTGSDTIDVNANDALGGIAALQTIAVAINPVTTGQTYTLTTGNDTVAGNSAPNTIDATGGTLTAGDQIDGGSSGANSLVLQGPGLFNLAAPQTLTDIATLTAQEGRPGYGAFASQIQTITLRDGLDLTVNVTAAAASANPKAPTINITGAHNADIINLATGNDIVTVGDARETVHGGTGTDSIYVNASTIGATIDGGTSGKSALMVTGGGAVTMGPSITNITAANLLPTAGSYVFLANATSGLVVTDLSLGLDTLQAGGANQTLTGGSAGNLTLIGAGAGGDTFKDTAALLNGDLIRNFAAQNDLIDITNMNPSTVGTPSFVQNAGSGVLSVSDGTHSTAITLAGSFSQSGFSTAADGTGNGTLISYHQPV